VSWRLPPSAAQLVSDAFYPQMPFVAGTPAASRSLTLARRQFLPPIDARQPDVHAALDHAAATGWGYIELPQRHTARADEQTAQALAGLVGSALARSGTVVSELPAELGGRMLTPADVAVVTAHTDQARVVQVALEDAGLAGSGVTVSTANRIQGREFAVVMVWHPLAGRLDASEFHLDPGRMCVMLSRHRHACVVVGRVGAEQILLDFPDNAGVAIGEPEPLVDGRVANIQVLQHLAGRRAS